MKWNPAEDASGIFAGIERHYEEQEAVDGVPTIIAKNRLKKQRNTDETSTSR